MIFTASVRKVLDHPSYDTRVSKLKRNNCSQATVFYVWLQIRLGGRTVSRLSYGCTNFLSFSGRKTSFAREDGVGNATDILCSIPSYRLPRMQTPWWVLHEIRASHGNECKGHRFLECITVWYVRTTFWIISFFRMVGELTVRM